MATPLDTLTIILADEVSLDDFAKAITNFGKLVKGLSADIGGEDLYWVVADLEISSAIATVKGIGDITRVERVVRAYPDVGDAIRKNTLSSYSKPVQEAALNLRQILGKRVKSIRFETAEREVIIQAAKTGEGISQPNEQQSIPVTPLSPSAAYGSLHGRIQTLTSRGGLRFTLYDLLYDKAVSCYLKEDYEEIMRNAWGKLALVTGWISRDPVSGRPLSIRQVDSVDIQAEEFNDYREARAASPPLSKLSPEDAIRKLRDA